jgi:hypothetical protein
MTQCLKNGICLHGSFVWYTDDIMINEKANQSLASESQENLPICHDFSHVGSRRKWTIGKSICAIRRAFYVAFGLTQASAVEYLIPLAKASSSD